MEQLINLIKKSECHNREYFNLIFNRFFFYTKGYIISFPRNIYLKFQDNDTENCLLSSESDYDFKMNSYEVVYTDEDLATFRYLGHKKDIIIEPEYHTLKNLRKIFINRDPIIGSRLFRDWKTYFTYRGELKEHPDKNVILWEEPGIKYCFNKNLIV
jgi:hypothetical protein